MLLPFSVLYSGRIIEPLSRVIISWQPEPDMFPRDWRVPPVSAQARGLMPNQVKPQLDAVKRAMSRYSPELIRQNISRVYIVNGLSFYGLDYGGTYSHDRVYLVACKHNTGIVEASFHHEFSSILLRNHGNRFPKNDWFAELPPGTQYRFGGVEALRSGEISLAWSPQFHAQGFLCEYGKASFEEDVNTFAEALFTGQGVFRLAAQYPRIARKVHLLVSFYSSLDPALTRSSFENIEKNRTIFWADSPGLKHFSFSNGQLMQINRTVWQARLTGGITRTFRLTGKDRHYLYLTDVERNIFIGIPLNTEQNWLYRFEPQASGFAHHRMHSIP